MGNPVNDGETCERDINIFDKLNADALYPPPPVLRADVVVYRPGAGAWLIRRSFDGGLTQVNFWESKVLHQIMWVTAWALVWADDSRGNPAGAES